MLKFTKNQILILEVLFNKPEKAYYLRELGRMIGKEPGVFQRDVGKLTESGLILSSYQANSRFLKLNTGHLLYKELKSIFFKTLGVEGVLKKELKKIKGIKEAFIYGSFAKGDEGELSDIDLFMIGSINEDVFIDAISRLEKKFDRDISYVLMTEEEFRKKQKDENSFLINVFSKKRIKLI